jgi:hypothetical protein
VHTWHHIHTEFLQICYIYAYNIDVRNRMLECWKDTHAHTVQMEEQSREERGVQLCTHIHILSPSRIRGINLTSYRQIHQTHSDDFMSLIYAIIIIQFNYLFIYVLNQQPKGQL